MPGHARRSALVCVMAALLCGCGTVPTSLRHADDLAPGQPLPIDGVWRMTPGGQTFTIGRNHLVANDSYAAGVYAVKPGDVVGSGLLQDGPRSFRAHDILWNASWHGVLQDDGTIDVTLHTLVPAKLTLTPIELAWPEWHAAQAAADAVVPAPRGVAPTPGLAASPAPVLEAAALGAAGSPLGPEARARFGRYHALVIGNNDYAHFDRLLTARSDAEAVARLLEQRYDFAVTLLLDATREDILLAFAELRRGLTAEDNLLIYYAGHGWLDEAADEGYWLPVDAMPDNVVNWVANSAITAYFKSIEAKHILVVADSCYSGTLTRGIQAKARTPSYLQRMAERKARVVMTSGGVEPVTDSGGRAGHSAFASAFLDALEANEGVLDTSTLYNQIRRPVLLAADQDPDIADIRKAGHAGGDFLFVRAR